MILTCEIPFLALASVQTARNESHQRRAEIIQAMFKGHMAAVTVLTTFNPEHRTSSMPGPGTQLIFPGSQYRTHKHLERLISRGARRVDVLWATVAKGADLTPDEVASLKSTVGPAFTLDAPAVLQRLEKMGTWDDNEARIRREWERDES